MDVDPELTRSERRAARRRASEEARGDAGLMFQVGRWAAMGVGIAVFFVAVVYLFSNHHKISYSITETASESGRGIYTVQVAAWRAGDAEDILDDLYVNLAKRPFTAEIYCHEYGTKTGTLLGSGSRDATGVGSQSETGASC